ncbi:IS30 family transposase [Gryllotalpicola ginsengisoli]|uniref:IS30 family transposase n=1 Tax=Gryllotalpicola ginsengisoli TaxID=444608 RepID=UPI0003B5FF5D|nr:IS30 family transposase [Gryllotalpicola ginsengisoli]
MLLTGVSAVRVREHFGLSRNTVEKWARLAGMKFAPGSAPGLLDPDPPAVLGAVSGHGRRLSLGDRAVIQLGLAEGKSRRAIAALIGVAPSTVSREIAAAQLVYRSESRYDAGIAHQIAADRRRRPKARKLDGHPELRAAVVRQLNQKFSPQQVAGRLPLLFAAREDMRVSHEAIYQSLYVQGKGALRHELTVHKALRSGRTGRVPQSKLPPRSSRPWLDGARISDRPARAEDRAVPGHWEGDLVVGPGNSGLITLVERSSRFALISRLPGMRDSETVIDGLTRMIQQLPHALFETLTWDQGSEMAQHAKFTIATGCAVYFADPHSPWQRGSNENLNGLIRDFYPKGTNFNTITDAEIAEMQRLLNMRPRMTLNYATPAERLDEHIKSGVALTG